MAPNIAALSGQEQQAVPEKVPPGELFATLGMCPLLPIFSPQKICTLAVMFGCVFASSA